MESIRILLADDHAVVRFGLAAIFDRLEGFEVVGESTDGIATVEAAKLLQPDIVLMDLQMPGLDGIEATRRLAATAPQVRVVVLTMFDDDHTVFAALQAGARGYLIKDAGHEEIAAALRAVVAGQAVFGQGLATRMLNYFAESGPHAPYPFEQLDQREREILELLATGLRTADIAARLYLSPKTISNQLTRIYHKLGVNDRGGAVDQARDHGVGLGR